MATVRRSIIHFDPDVLRALRLHAATSGRNLSEVVNEMVWRAMEEDLADLATVRKRRDEPRRSMQSVVREMRRRRRL
jgi:hypothetical protein